MPDAHDLLSSLYTDDPADDWAGLLAQAGRAWLEGGLAHGEYLDGLHADDSRAQPATRALAADTTAAWPRRYTSGDWILLVDQHPDGGFFVRLQGPTEGTLLHAGEWSLAANVWQRLPLEDLPTSVSLRLTDGSVLTLSSDGDG